MKWSIGYDYLNHFDEVMDYMTSISGLDELEILGKFPNT